MFVAVGFRFDDSLEYVKNTIIYHSQESEMVGCRVPEVAVEFPWDGNEVRPSHAGTGNELSRGHGGKFFHI